MVGYSAIGGDIRGTFGLNYLYDGVPLGDVAAEEERDCPVRDDAQLSRQERELVQVVRPRDEPGREAAEAEAHQVGDAEARLDGVVVGRQFSVRTVGGISVGADIDDVLEQLPLSGQGVLIVAQGGQRHADGSL